MAKTRVCSFRNCPALVEGGYRCEKHPQVKRIYKKHQLTNEQRGYGSAHRRWQKAILTRDPVCRHCPAPATEAHHIDSNTRNRALENGMGLCRRCHNRVTHGRDYRSAPELRRIDEVAGGRQPSGLWFA